MGNVNRWREYFEQWQVLDLKTHGSDPEYAFPIVALIENCHDRESVVIEKMKIVGDTVELILIDEKGFFSGTDISTLERTKKVLSIKKPFNIKYARDRSRKNVFFTDFDRASNGTA